MADTTALRRTENISAASNKYNFTSCMYPEDAQVREDLQHYIVFYINVRQSSKFDTTKRVGFVSNGGQNRTDAANAGAIADTVKVAAAGLMGAALGYGIGAKVGRNLAKTASTFASAAAAGTALGVSATLLGGIGGSGTIYEAEKTQRITDAIFLALQSAPSVKYGVAWETGELGTIGGLLAGGTSAVDGRMSGANVSSDIARRMAETVGSIPGSLNSSNQIQNMIESSTKRVANPQREQLFKSVGFRTFQFTYKFMPKSPAETANVKNIIEKFKLHMHPELSDSGIYYIYPSEFDIQYYYAGKENKYFNKISTCALTDLTVDYGGATFSTFDDGSPTEYNVTLTFTELETMTKERIQEGY